MPPFFLWMILLDFFHRASLPLMFLHKELIYWEVFRKMWLKNMKLDRKASFLREGGHVGHAP